MTNPTLSKLGDLEITLSRAGRTCALTGAELAQLLDSPGVVIRLAAVLYSRSRPVVGRKGTTKKGEAVRQQQETDERGGIENVLGQRSFGWDGESKREGVSTRGQAAERTASYLADKLGDAKSIAFFRRAAEALPPEVIRDALVRALDLRPSDVRRSRAAYFTSLIMPHLRRCEPKA
jgi:hypothetical protein